MNEMNANQEHLMNALRERNFHVTFCADGDIYLYWVPGDPASGHFLGTFQALIDAYRYAESVFQLLTKFFN